MFKFHRIEHIKVWGKKTYKRASITVNEPVRGVLNQL